MPVKRILPIVLIFIVVLNTMGYYAIYLSLHYLNDRAYSKAMDSGIYDKSRAIILKIPVSIPYMSDQADFERIHGKFEHGGETYRLLKQRYAEDTLTVVFLWDTEHKKIDHALTDYVTTFTDKIPHSKPRVKLAITFLKDYLPIAFTISSATAGWAAKIIRPPSNEGLVSTYLAWIAHPPERVPDSGIGRSAESTVIRCL